VSVVEGLAEHMPLHGLLPLTFEFGTRAI